MQSHSPIVELSVKYVLSRDGWLIFLSALIAIAQLFFPIMHLVFLLGIAGFVIYFFVFDRLFVRIASDLFTYSLWRVWIVFLLLLPVITLLFIVESLYGVQVTDFCPGVSYLDLPFGFFSLEGGQCSLSVSFAQFTLFFLLVYGICLFIQYLKEEAPHLSDIVLDQEKRGVGETIKIVVTFVLTIAILGGGGRGVLVSVYSCDVRILPHKRGYRCVNVT